MDNNTIVSSDCQDDLIDDGNHQQGDFNFTNQCFFTDQFFESSQGRDCEDRQGSAASSSDRASQGSSSIAKSIRKPKYKPTNDGLRQNLIDLVSEGGLSIKDAAAVIGMNYSTAKSVMQVFKREGRTFKRNIKNNAKASGSPTASASSRLLTQLNEAKNKLSKCPQNKALVDHLARKMLANVDYCVSESTNATSALGDQECISPVDKRSTDCDSVQTNGKSDTAWKPELKRVAQDADNDKNDNQMEQKIVYIPVFYHSNMNGKMHFWPKPEHQLVIKSDQHMHCCCGKDLNPEVYSGTDPWDSSQPRE